VIFGDFWRLLATFGDFLLTFWLLLATFWRLFGDFLATFKTKSSGHSAAERQRWQINVSEGRRFKADSPEFF
jgi:hypothetical protein